MSDFSPVSRLGQSLASGDARALFLKLFSGEVQRAFENETKFLDKHRVRTISGGKSAQFPAIGKTTAAYHTPGAEIQGKQIKHSERVLTVDNLLISPVFISNIDEVMNHYDVRGPYSNEIGRALARVFDRRVARTVARAARSAAVDTANFNGGSSGAKTADSGFRSTNAATVAGELTALIWKGVQTFNEKNIPESDRYLALAPAQYYLLLSNPTSGVSGNPLVINKDWGGAGSYADGTVVRIGGMTITMSNNMPQLDTTDAEMGFTAISGYADAASGNVAAATTGVVTYDVAANTGGESYGGDFRKTLALMWHKDAVGTLKLMDLSMESEYSVRHQGTLMVARMATGSGVLRPEGAIELTSGAIAAQGGLTPTAITGGSWA